MRCLSFPHTKPARQTRKALENEPIVDCSPISQTGKNGVFRRRVGSQLGNEMMARRRDVVRKELKNTRRLILREYRCGRPAASASDTASAVPPPTKFGLFHPVPAGRTICPL